MTELLYGEESYKILGASFEVYNRKGCGFLEPVYQECMELELAHNGICHAPQPRLQLTYRDQVLKQHYVPDFVCYDKIILELKAVSKLTDEHRAQVLNYLNATGHKLGILLNFGHYPKLEYERIVLDTRRINGDTSSVDAGVSWDLDL